MSDKRTVANLVAQIDVLRENGKLTKDQIDVVRTVFQIVETENYVATGMNPEMAKNAYRDGMITKGMCLKELEFWAFR